jgi:NAD+ kinase
MPRNVLLLVNRDKPEVTSALDEIRTLITARGRIVRELAADHSIDALRDATTPSGAAPASEVDLIVVLGGDGTLMGQVRRCLTAGIDLPMLGVNFGKLGFLAEFDLPALRQQATSLFDGSPLDCVARHALEVSVHHGGPTPIPAIDVRGSTRRATGGLALNDAVITAGPPYRMITLDVRIDGHPGPQVTGDGIVIATPIGSTAYNVSAGGPIIAPDADALVITPIAAHSLAFRPVVVPASSVIDITVQRVNDEGDAETPGHGTSLVLDGQVSARLHQDDVVRFRRHPRQVRFVKNPRSSYWQTLISKMRWAAPPSLKP